MAMAVSSKKPQQSSVSLRRMGLYLCMILGLYGSIYADAVKKSSLQNTSYDEQSKWYTEEQICIMKRSRTVKPSCSARSIYSIAEECGGDPAKLHVEPFYVMTPKKQFCPTQHMSLTDREFTKLADGYEDGSTSYFTSFFDALSAQNRGFMMMGDSINHYMNEALISEALRMGYEISQTHLEERHVINTPRDKKCLAAMDQSHTTVTMTTIHSTAQTHPGIPPKSARIYNPTMFQERLSSESCDDEFVFESLRFISKKNPQGLVLFGNIGPHYADLNATELRSAVRGFFGNLHAMTLWNPKNIAVFRETFATHFPNPIGIYKHLHRDDIDRIVDMGVTYPCEPIENMNSARLMQAPENRYAREFSNNVKYDVSVFPTWDESASWTNMHDGWVLNSATPYYCPTRRDHDGAKMDCRHWCGYAPNLWAPIWDRLGKMVVDTKP
jgi:hypothetical protein